VDVLEKRKISSPYGDLDPELSSPYPSLYTDYVTRAASWSVGCITSMSVWQELPAMGALLQANMLSLG
jgi:hypothetical protein